MVFFKRHPPSTKPSPGVRPCRHPSELVRPSYKLWYILFADKPQITSDGIKNTHNSPSLEQQNSQEVTQINFQHKLTANMK